MCRYVHASVTCKYQCNCSVEIGFHVACTAKLAKIESKRTWREFSCIYVCTVYVYMYYMYSVRVHVLYVQCTCTRIICTVYVYTYYMYSVRVHVLYVQCTRVHVLYVQCTCTCIICTVYKLYIKFGKNKGSTSETRTPDETLMTCAWFYPFLKMISSSLYISIVIVKTEDTMVIGQIIDTATN